MSRPWNLKPISVYAASRPHGDRLRYMAGCKCAECRAANSHYESSRRRARRAGDWNGIIPAGKARRRILALSRKNVGRRAIAVASDVGETIVHEIKTGKRQQIRARTERRILSVTIADARDHALVPARRTWQLLHQLRKEGYTKVRLARELGYQAKNGRPSIQFRKNFVLVRSAWRVARMFRQLTE